MCLIGIARRHRERGEIGCPPGEPDRALEPGDAQVGRRAVADREGEPPPELPFPDFEPEIDSLAWIHVRDRRLLSVRTAGKAKFYLPGGKREPGEGDVAGLCREIAESAWLSSADAGVCPPAGQRVLALLADAGLVD